jgi:cellulose synthase/poly-beta-1,6-N-acetylglucosamine synthase-like glycosyltransferase
MEIYGFSFSSLEWIVLSILLATFVYQIYFYTRYIQGVLRYKRKIKKNKITFQQEQQPVSVIICAKDEAENLRKYLPFVLQQDYPDYEVIVINDGSTDETDILLRDLSREYTRLRTTFVPVGANNISTKKLGLTLGIKASKNDILLFTDADCMPEDKTWISRMMRNFNRETAFVLGYGAYFHRKSLLNRLITYDTLFNGLQYMGMALAHKPYMGVGRNLAYRKDVFFKQKGFADNLKLNSGDDDLMVNHAATALNTRVEIAPDSVTWSEPNSTLKGWLFQKQRHLAASKYYKFSSKFRLGFEPFTRAWFYITFIAALIIGIINFNFIVIALAAVFFIVRFATQLVIFNRSAHYLGDRKHFFTLLLFDICLPLLTLYILLFSKKGRNKSWK